MNRLPDAPWIRDAEQNGVDEGPNVTCPCCGLECEQFVLADPDENHTILGCDRCTSRMDVWDWWERYGGGAERDDGGED